jgi:hypothetical protein
VYITIACGLPPVAEAVEKLQDQFSTSWIALSESLPPVGRGNFSLAHGQYEGFTLFETDANKSGRGYRWEGPPAEFPDWRGIKWDTFYFVAYQFVAVGVIYFLPESISGWTEEDKEEYSFSKWVNNVRNPVWDEDEWYVNYILHPYWGAAYYIRALERGFGRMHAFWYSFLLSTLYEFGAEALFEPVSYQDLVVTPVGGALLGEYVFAPIRERIRAKSGRLDWSDKTLLLLTDPLGVVSEATSRFLGVNTAMGFQPLVMEAMLLSPEVSDASDIGLPARVSGSPVWGLHITITW